MPYARSLCSSKPDEGHAQGLHADVHPSLPPKTVCILVSIFQFLSSNPSSTNARTMSIHREQRWTTELLVGTLSLRVTHRLAAKTIYIHPLVSFAKFD